MIDWLTAQQSTVAVGLLLALAVWIVSVEIRIHQLQAWAWPRLDRKRGAGIVFAPSSKRAGETIDATYDEDEVDDVER